MRLFHVKYGRHVDISDGFFVTISLQGLGKAIKDRMKAKFEKDFDERHDAWCDGKIKASERRILMAKWLGESWTEFFAEGGQAQVEKAFKRCGMLNAIDGSEDSEIHVQGIEDYTIGESSDEEESESDGSDGESETEGSDSDSESGGNDDESKNEGESESSDDSGNDSEGKSDSQSESTPSDGYESDGDSTSGSLEQESESEESEPEVQRRSKSHQNQRKPKARATKKKAAKAPKNNKKKRSRR